MPSGDGAFYLYLNGRVRSEAGVVVGDAVQVEVMFDATYSNGPQHPMPSWFKQALKQNSLAERNWMQRISAKFCTPASKSDRVRLSEWAFAPQSE